MKKLFLLFAVPFMVTATANAQPTPASLRREIRMDKKNDNKMGEKVERKALRKLVGDEVSFQSKQAFARDFGKSTIISSQRLENFDEFTFTTKKGASMSAFYDADSKLVGTLQNKSYADLPSKGQEEIQKYYSDYTPGDVVFFDDNEMNETDMILYGLQFDDVDSYFVEMKKGTNTIVVQVLKDGVVNYFTKLT